MAERSRAQYVQLETGDDVSSVRDRLSFVRGQKVLLIWPENGTILTRKLDLVLIQREAMRRAIRLALVTHDSEVVKHASELNISTFETIGASERGRWMIQTWPRLSTATPETWPSIQLLGSGFGQNGST